MYTKQPNQLLIVNILEILRKYSDSDHRLSQKDISDLLRKEYDMKAGRRRIRRDILNLIDFGCEIEYSETVRVVTNKKTGEPEESCIMSDFFLLRDFSDGELRLLIDSVLFSRQIPFHQRKELVEKLESLSSRYFHAHVRHIHTVPDTLPPNPQLFYTIEVLDEAISAEKKVSFSYLEFGTDKKRRRKRGADGEIRKYVVSPYQMAAKEGKYYLICNFEPYNDISNYRVDRVADICLLDEPIKPFKTLDGVSDVHLDLAGYMAEHIYMYSSKNVKAKFRVVRPMVSDVIDMFGTDVAFSEETDGHVTVTAKVNEMAMKQFAKSFAPDVIVLSPKALADSVKEEARRTVKAYEETEE
ncbi:MAG: helix-turn-helix transcriptional regulator [Bacillota bacterium]